MHQPIDSVIDPPRPVRLSPAHATILVVDDGPDILPLLTTGLGGAGYRVATAASFPAAEVLLRARRFALIVADAGRDVAGDEAAARWIALDRLRILAVPAPLLIITTRRSTPRADDAARDSAVIPFGPTAFDDFLDVVRGICPLPAR